MFKKVCYCSLLIVFSVLISACHKSSKQAYLPAGTVVLALGDSLTFGYGATPETSYPHRLAEISGWEVVNGGLSGDTSAQALARLPALLEEYHPKFVIISIGGNDFLRHQNPQGTRRNIEQMIQESRAANAEVLLVGIPSLSSSSLLGFPSDHELYQQIAEKEKVPLFAEAWSKVLKKSEWRSDQVHPNAQGYAVFTDELVKYLRETGRL
ncbi:arylesterase [Suttonella ornithocola]|uniref:Acyl-CoA thioesterase I n=1 Tax=Suttonella ornithocola TaxID=279832 RepID=A0A380MM82_9GAMM|nr:arylesterase [Suttonella ornithocola]SUO93294.1 Acyl-CoA thioesterase I precursor [Suttonella ornithocola]